MFKNKSSFSLKLDTKIIISIGIFILLLIVVQVVQNWDGADKTDLGELLEGQEYSLSEMIENQKKGSAYLLGDGYLTMGNIYLTEKRDGSGVILAGTTYHPGLVLIASYGSNGKMLEEQVVMGVKYPNVPAENPAETSSPIFGRHEELEIQAYAVEFTLPQGTETVKMYTG